MNISSHTLIKLILLLSISIVYPSNDFSQYSHIVEKLIYFKDDKFKAFYGGPIDREGPGVKWLLPIVFENQETHKTRAVYEVAFINCDIYSAKGAEILFIEVSDINIKFKNSSSPDYPVFKFLLDGGYKKGKYVVVRNVDVANVYYPDIFVASQDGKTDNADRQDICTFLHQTFQTAHTFRDFYNGNHQEEVQFENSSEVMYAPISLDIECDGTPYRFLITKRICKEDPWKLYYVIMKANTLVTGHLANHPVILRLDSGCVSGQIYDDSACDCLDQLHHALKELANDSENGIIIHIPGHDGRGFGTAPKAETEIYKRGGKGRLHTTAPLDTVSAAKLLYGTQSYDLRTFDGAAHILKTMHIKKVILLTDNVGKVRALEKHGIEVERRKTNSQKASCLEHLHAKKKSDLYFAE